MLQILKREKWFVLLLAVILLTFFLAAPVFAEGDETRPAIFFQNDLNELKVWWMDQDSRTADDVFASIDPGWQAKAVADMNGDGHPDIYWLHENGHIKVWLMEGLKRIDTVYPHNPGTGEPQISPVWDMMAVADLNGNGEPDIIWQALEGPRKGDLAIWLMDGENADRYGKLYNHPNDAKVDPLWEIGAVIDLLGDGQPEVIWQSVSGGDYDSLAYWQLEVKGDDFTRSASDRLIHEGGRAEIRSQWRMKAAFDLLGDGRNEIVFQGISGNVKDRVSYWVMDGPIYVGGGRMDPDSVSSGWNIFGAAPIIKDPIMQSELKIVSSVDQLDDIFVKYGTKLEDVDLPVTLGVALDDGSYLQCSISWDGGNPGYNSDVAGVYIFTGELNLPANVVNLEEFTVAVNVIVEEDETFAAFWFYNTRPSAPSLIAPSNYAVVHGTNIHFRWNSAPRATRYFIQVRNLRTNKIVHAENVGNVTSRSFYNLPLPNDGTWYRWHLWAGNDAGWSNPSFRHFRSGNPTVIKPPAPRLISADIVASSGNTVRFRWDAASRATNYYLYVDRPSDNRLIYRGYVGNVTSKEISGFTNGTYRWYLWAHNSAGFSDASSRNITLRFHTDQNCSVKRGKEDYDRYNLITNYSYSIPATCFTNHGWYPPIFQNYLHTHTFYDYLSPRYYNVHGWQHGGVDFVGGSSSFNSNTEVRAIGPGVVTFVRRDYSSNYNNSRIHIKHTTASGKEFLVIYGHVYPASGLVRGSQVVFAQRIGTLRLYGWPWHLHFELSSDINKTSYGSYERGKTLDPLRFLIENPRR